MTSSQMTPAQIEALMNGPALMPPEGVTPNFQNPPNQNAMARAITGVCLGVAVLLVILRLYVKVFCTKRCRLEDLLGLLGFGFCVAHTWTAIELSIDPGFFVHQWNIQVKQMGHWGTTLNLLRTFYFLTIGLIKNAILLEWTHIFVLKKTRNSFFWLCHGLIAVNTILYLASVIATHLMCIPIESMWYPWLSQESKCIDRKPADVSVMSFNLLTNLIILFLPQRIIWKLNLPKTKRIGITIVFSIGVLTCVCAAGMVYSVSMLTYSALDDSIYDVSVTIMWGVGEATCLLAVFCAPAASAAIRGEGKLLPRLTQSLRSWVAMSRGSRSSPENNHGRAAWRSMAPSGKVYERADDSSQVGLAGLEQVKVTQPVQGSVGDRGIMGTFEFNTEAGQYEYMKGQPMQYRPQYSWPGQRV